MSVGDDGLGPGGILEQFRLLDRSQDGSTSVQVRSGAWLHMVFSFKNFPVFNYYKLCTLKHVLCLKLYYVSCIIPAYVYITFKPAMYRPGKHRIQKTDLRGKIPTQNCAKNVCSPNSNLNC